MDGMFVASVLVFGEIVTYMLLVLAIGIALNHRKSVARLLCCVGTFNDDQLTEAISCPTIS